MRSVKKRDLKDSFSQKIQSRKKAASRICIITLYLFSIQHTVLPREKVYSLRDHILINPLLLALHPEFLCLLIKIQCHQSQWLKFFPEIIKAVPLATEYLPCQNSEENVADWKSFGGGRGRQLR